MNNVEEYRRFCYAVKDSYDFIHNEQCQDIFKKIIEFMNHEIIITSAKLYIDLNIGVKYYVSDEDNYHALLNTLNQRNFSYVGDMSRLTIYINLMDLCNFLDSWFAKSMIDNVIVEETTKESISLFTKVKELESRIDELEREAICKRMIE